MSIPSSPSRFSGRPNVTPSKTKAVDLGKSLGSFDTNPVRERIRNWQAQGGGVVAADDIGEDDDVKPDRAEGKSSKRDSTPYTPRHTEKESSRNTTPRSGRKTTKADGGREERTRSGSAPAKRIISDGHWKKKRSPPKSANSSRDIEKTLSRLLPDDGIRVKPSAISSGYERHEKHEGSTFKENGYRGDDGIRVFVTPPESHKSSRSRNGQGGIPVSEKPCRSEAEEERMGSPSQSRRQRDHPASDESLHAEREGSSGKSGRRRSTGRKPEASPQSAKGASSDHRGSIKSQKTNLLSQVFGDSKKAPIKPIPDMSPTPRIPSIEAWLNETSDPFVEAEEQPLEFIAPLKSSTERNVSKPLQNVAEEVSDPNKIWDTLDTKEGTRRVVSASKRRRRIPSSAIYEDNPFPAGFDSDTGGLAKSDGSTTSASKFVDLVQGSSTNSPSSLKRRSARKSTSSPGRDRHKSSKNKGLCQEGDVSSCLSSNPDVSPDETVDTKNLLIPSKLNIRRPFPTTGGHRLSTIASVETFQTNKGPPPGSIAEKTGKGSQPILPQAVDNFDEARDEFDPDSLKRSNSRLTKHADLISVLSIPKPSSRSIQSARSIRTNRSRLANATIEDLMQELATDEGKYMRELRTLVDGVIPVLLTCVLSKSDSAVAAGLFRPSAVGNEDPNFTKPIVDMGIALERLKTLHRRIPQDNPNSLMTWAHSAQRVYAEYLRAWRMGFQDVIVNLAPAADDASKASNPSTGITGGLEEGLPRNADGDVVNGDGERVDVAFLLKRPLVRLKYLQKTLKGINFVKPSTEAQLLADKYQKLVDDARRRSNEERARLEDEAASNIDPTRTRDTRTLAPLPGVVIDRSRRVRARDNFNLALQHSSGQYVDCRVELILRDEASDAGVGGDMLVCEMDATGKWLLFPPVQIDKISSRNGDRKGEIVIMIRGIASNGSEWHELLSLRSEDEQAGFEWVQMLGLTPVPPQIMRSQSFVSKHRRRRATTTSTLETPSAVISPGKSRTPSPREIEVPIGEQAVETSKSWVESFTDGLPPIVKDPATVDQERPLHHSLPTTPARSSNYVEQVNDLRSLPSQVQAREPISTGTRRTPRSFKEALGLSGTSTTVGLKRTRAKRVSKYTEGSPSRTGSRSRDGDRSDKECSTPPPDAPLDPQPTSISHKSPRFTRSPSPEAVGNHAEDESDRRPPKADHGSRPQNHRSLSSVPSMELPYIPKARKDSPPTTPTFESEQEPEWPSPSVSQLPQTHPDITKRRPVSAGRGSTTANPSPNTIDHKPSAPVQLGGISTPVLSKSPPKQRRSSSPLKHQYEPSTASESSSDSDTSTVEHNRSTSISDSSDDDDELEEGDAPTPLIPLGALKRLPGNNVASKILSGSTPASTIKPSESASQAPYKTVPAQPAKASKTIASIFSWSDTGSWQSLHPDECSIAITPGLIEAFEMTAAHSQHVPLSSPTPIIDTDAFSEIASNLTSQNDGAQDDRPLVALELTPLVPLRRGTALDISIRSPPTPNSIITSGNNIMFRSRNPEECEALYALINHARINNPTFIALQNARASGSSFGGDRNASTTASGSRPSWFGGWGRSSSYRASSAPTPSIAPSESSIGSMSSAFSALKRFGGRGGGMFNIARSTIMSREGSRANSIYTSSDNSSGSGASSPVPPSMANSGKDGAIGLSNAKIRLYIRESASKWRDMGSARLTIMRPETNDQGVDGRPGSSGVYQAINEKRVVVHGKTKGEVLLDVQLRESCFERVARTGIAISVWEDVVGPNGEVGVVKASGGVAGGSATVYMLQMKNEVEAAYTFSIVGKLRY